jgi:hypothetical protein
MATRNWEPGTRNPPGKGGTTIMTKARTGNREPETGNRKQTPGMPGDAAAGRPGNGELPFFAPAGRRVVAAGEAPAAARRAVRNPWER